MEYTYEDVAKMIDHSLLNPTLTVDDLESGIALAKAYDVASVCILPHALKRASELLAGSTVQPSTTSDTANPTERDAWFASALARSCVSITRIAEPGKTTSSRLTR